MIDFTDEELIFWRKHYRRVFNSDIYRVVLSYKQDGIIVKEIYYAPVISKKDARADTHKLFDVVKIHSIKKI